MTTPATMLICPRCGLEVEVEGTIEGALPCTVTFHRSALRDLCCEDGETTHDFHCHHLVTLIETGRRAA